MNSEKDLEEARVEAEAAATGAQNASGADGGGEVGDGMDTDKDEGITDAILDRISANAKVSIFTQSG